jgi:hypothetical protein
MRGSMSYLCVRVVCGTTGFSLRLLADRVIADGCTSRSTSQPPVHRRWAWWGDVCRAHFSGGGHATSLARGQVRSTGRRQWRRRRQQRVREGEVEHLGRGNPRSRWSGAPLTSAVEEHPPGWYIYGPLCLSVVRLPVALHTSTARHS